MRIGNLLFRLVKLALVGSRLEEASLRHSMAANRLDMLVREALRQ